MSNNSQYEKKRKRRSICGRCERPTPQACICAGLPTSPLTLSKSRVLVLQHPQEARRKNRSLPLVEMCFSSNSSSCFTNKREGLNANDDCSAENDFMFHTVVGRRFGHQTNSNIMRILQDPTQVTLLIYPSEDAICLDDALEQVKRNQMESQTTNKSSNKIAKITLVFLDATWKYAKEMENACTIHKVWPSNLIRVKLSPTNTNKTLHDFQPRRFDIRAPPSPNHLSTAECIARVLTLVEDSVSIFDVLMKPLDLMVQQWHSFSKSKVDEEASVRTDKMSVNDSMKKRKKEERLAQHDETIRM